MIASPVCRVTYLCPCLLLLMAAALAGVGRFPELLPAGLGRASMHQLLRKSPYRPARPLSPGRAAESSEQHGAAAGRLQQLLRTPPQVTGRVKKSGPPLPQIWTPAARQGNRSEFARWEEETAAHPNASLAASWQAGVRLPNLPPNFESCLVYVNHRYKVLYVSHPKSGSSSVLDVFGICGWPYYPGAKDVPKGGQGRHEGQQRLPKGAACMKGLGDMHPAEAHAMWSEYFVFTMVRNPYARLVSAYSWLVSKMGGDSGCPSVRWEAFCSDPLAPGRVCKEKPACCPLQPRWYWKHVMDQGRCVVAEDGGWAVDYVACVENLEQQLLEVVAEIDRRRDPWLPPLLNVTYPLEHSNQGRRAKCSADGKPEPRQLQPRPAVISMVGIRYNAAEPLDSYCTTAEYDQGEHARCLAQATHFYQPDFGPGLYTAHDAGAEEGGSGASPLPPHHRKLWR